MTKSTINLPTTAFSALRKTPTEFVQEMRIAAAIKWYGLEQISQSKADEFADFGRFSEDSPWAVLFPGVRGKPTPIGCGPP